MKVFLKEYFHRQTKDILVYLKNLQYTSGDVNIIKKISQVKIFKTGADELEGDSVWSGGGGHNFIRGSKRL